MPELQGGEVSELLTREREFQPARKRVKFKLFDGEFKALPWAAAVALGLRHLDRAR